MEKRNIKYMFDKTSETPSNDVTKNNGESRDK